MRLDKLSIIGMEQNNFLKKLKLSIEININMSTTFLNSGNHRGFWCIKAKA